MNRALSLLIPALAAAALACATTQPQPQPPPPAPAPEEKPAPVEAQPAPEPEPAPAAQPSPPMEIDRAQFTMTGPAGYKELDDPRLAPIKNGGGVVIGSEPSAQGLYPSSIFVTPVPAMKQVGTQAGCQEIAGSAASASSTTLKDSRIVETKAGPSCQFDLVATSDQVRAARGTILNGPSAWSIMCNYDARDQKALADCEAATQSFAFKPGLAPEQKAPAKGKKK